MSVQDTKTDYLGRVEALRDPRGARRTKLAPSECQYCDRERDNNFHPPHDASPHCQSGKWDHCSCDTCF